MIGNDQKNYKSLDNRYYIKDLEKYKDNWQLIENAINKHDKK